ncbi:hypothetical protein WH47_10000 [Habropoda laboriosa]|uniref:Uncharacterized protein n=1 Tax=Habropoda laboriosa TaxID=597456 RepID=A0A0L7R3U8_9HYME|nr:hypothetical protein WH47_10000 [Habropoda laboriosa]
MHDAHFSRLARQFLNERFPNNPLDCYLWRHLKSLVYNTPVDNVEDLRYRVQVVGEFKHLVIFERVRNNRYNTERAIIRKQGHIRYIHLYELFILFQRTESISEITSTCFETPCIYTNIR